jgi:hypothetical protein
MSINYKPNNTLIFCYVRMNPPTPGHLALIGEMINTAADLNIEKIYIITSSTMDGKNPLPCSDDTIPKSINRTIFDVSSLIYKENVLQNMINSYREELAEKQEDLEKKNRINNLHIIVICSQGSPFGTFFKIIENDFQGITDINLYFFAGRDRANFLDTIIDNYSKDNFKDKPNIYSVNGDVLGRQGMAALKDIGIGDRNVSQIKVSEYSASFVRNLVNPKKKNFDTKANKNTMVDKTPQEIQRDREFFDTIYSPYMSQENISKLYETIKDGLTLKQPSSKEEDENPPTKYFTDYMDPYKPGYHMKEINPETGRPFLPIVKKSQGTKRKIDSDINGGKKSKKKYRKNKRKTRKHKNKK